MQSPALPLWFPDESAHAGPEHLDAGYVAAYEDKAGVDFSDDIALLRDLGLNEAHTLVDLGSGTGSLALAVAPYCRKVIAIDVSPAMVNAQKQKAARLGLANIACVQAGFLSYRHQGDPVDFVYSRNALHHLPDFWKAIALERIAAILKPGGVLRLRDLIYSFDPGDADLVFEAWLGHAPDRPERGWTRAELETHIRDEYSTFSWLLEPMLERAGFAIQDESHDSSRVFSAYTCIKA